MNCQRNNISWCLDWREVCDGKADCWPNPVDEQHCQILERNECASNEYRCFNGQCIPEIFLLDKSFISDCIDDSDEDILENRLYKNLCIIGGNPSFRCTDTKCPHWSFYVETVDDQECSPSYSRINLFEKFERRLLSPTANTHINEKCWATMICLIQAEQRISFVSLTFVPYTYLANPHF